MPRGKNYVNNNRGVYLKGKSKVTEKCFYGANCTRKDCIYMHPQKQSPTPHPQSTEPCMAFLAKICPFGRNCRKRHPQTEEERQQLIEQFGKIPCRFGLQCQTKGCLFQHPKGDPSAFTLPAAIPSSLTPNPMMNFRPTSALKPEPLPQSFQPQWSMPPHCTPVPRYQPAATYDYSSNRYSSDSYPSYDNNINTASAENNANGELNVNARSFVPGGGFS